ncbi:unnamed protein product [Auanema sp. JU1783]|nr:unnamed protein product [Auanema sp. JU1783]
MEADAVGNHGSSNPTTTVTISNETRPATQERNELVLRLRSVPEESPRVTFASTVVDNEHLGRLKSNCCCIYVKPRIWDDPSTWEQDEQETEHCRGHTLPEPNEKNKNDGSQ